MVAGIVLLILTSSLFRFLKYQDQTNTANAVAGILRNEYISANSYALSKTLADLELLKIISCATLVEASDTSKIYYDTSENSNCARGKLITAIGVNRFRINAINGVPYDLGFQLPFHWSLIFAELLSYALITIVFVAYARHWSAEKERHAIRLRALAVEKEMAIDLKNQVRHDVASPLTALRSIVRLLSNVDPEIQNFLSRAVSRTEEIFNQLQEQPTEISSTSLQQCVFEIVNEKTVQWGAACEIRSKIFMEDLLFVSANSRELKRLLSNILNNAFESLDSGRRGVISIDVQKTGERTCLIIADNGRGMSQEVLQSAGTKGFTYGKTAGTGLGLHYAMRMLHLWGGDLIFSSNLAAGTEVRIYLSSAVPPEFSV